MPQQIERQVFPIPLEWLGGRGTLQRNAFSSRYASICLEDMKESESAVPVIVEKNTDKITFKSNNDSVQKAFDLKDIAEIYIFPSDPEFAVFEVAPENGQSRFEVVHALENEPLHQIYDFIYAHNFVQPSAPVILNENNLPASSPSDGYDVPEISHPAISSAYASEFQTEEAYEEMAAKANDNTSNESEGSVIAPDVRDPVEATIPAEAMVAVKLNGIAKEGEVTEEEEGEEHVDNEEAPRPRSSTSTTSVSSNSSLDKLQHEDDSAIVLNGESEVTPLQTNEKDVPIITKAVELQRFGKLRRLADIIAEENINTKHYRDDGQIYIFMKKDPKLSKIKLKPMPVSAKRIEHISTNGVRKSSRH